MAEDDSGSTPKGLLQCLNMLADEADAMRLGRTSVAIRTAFEICRAEANIDFSSNARHPLGSALH